MDVLHQANPTHLPTILTKGLKRTSRGDKGDDQSIVQADRFLDQRRPDELTSKNVSRDDNLYAYVCIGTTVIDIVDGRKTPLETFLTDSEPTLLLLAIDPTRAFVSDLDIYDELKDALVRGSPSYELEKISKRYWDSLCRLDHFTPDIMTRPEIMITYDIPLRDISILKR